jgi:hypothetical protein
MWECEKCKEINKDTVDKCEYCDGAKDSLDEDKIDLELYEELDENLIKALQNKLRSASKTTRIVMRVLQVIFGGIAVAMSLALIACVIQSWSQNTTFFNIFNCMVVLTVFPFCVGVILTFQQAIKGQMRPYKAVLAALGCLIPSGLAVLNSAGLM